MELRPIPAGNPLRAVRRPADAQRPPRRGGRGEPAAGGGRARGRPRVPAGHLPRKAPRRHRRVGRAAGDLVSRRSSQARPGTGRVVTAMTAVSMRRALDAKATDAVMTAAQDEAVRNGYRVVITVVDAWGHVLQLRRTEGAQAPSDRVAIDKARTAAIFVRPSREIEEQVSGGRLGALALHGATALTGGIPLTVDGEVIGAIGTSGETPDQDESVSLAGARAAYSTTAVPALTREGAQVAAEADAGGELMHLWRPDLAQVASVQVATDKARTAALFRRPSKDFEDQAAHGRPSALHLARAVPLQ